MCKWQINVPYDEKMGLVAVACLGAILQLLLVQGKLNKLI